MPDTGCGPHCGVKDGRMAHCTDCHGQVNHGNAARRGGVWVSRVPPAEQCDACLNSGQACPGYLAHCERGEHCTAQEHVCALDLKNDDHSKKCCVCDREVYCAG